MREKIIDILKEALGDDMVVELSVPEESIFGHYSTNVAMRVAKSHGKNPFALAQDFAAAIREKAPAGFFEKVEPVMPGFINFWLSKKTILDSFEVISREKDFGKSGFGSKKTIIVEYSSPNIAKEMNLGHFRNTIIGDALSNIFEAIGYMVVRWNYVGDWGTQFGKLIVAYRLWGNEAAVQKNPVEELQKLYVRFHDEAKLDPELDKRGQEEFKKLEAGERENRKLWEWFKKESLTEFEKMYEALGVGFSIWIGESFFESELKSVVRELLDREIAERSEGALIVKFEGDTLPPAMIEKSDGASLYLTRDIANLEYRLKTYNPSKILYVVGNEQALHFEQLFAVAKKLGLDSAELQHIKYGLVLGESGKKLSTRGGGAIGVKDILARATALARGVVEEKARDLTGDEKDNVAEAVGIGALKYNDLKENRTTDITFDWDKMLDFSGDSGPYLQYTYARLKSILRKSDMEHGKPLDFSLLDSEPEFALIRKIMEFPDAVQRAGEFYATSILALYLHRLGVLANKFYETTPILKDENEGRRNVRLVLITTAAKVLESGLGLLGIKVLEKI